MAILRQKGYFVRIARRAADAPKHPEGWQPTILVIDDDIDLQKLMRTYFVLEGFKVRAALKRDDIVIAMRLQPAPDLVLLDVHLGDADGFDILARMRQHPVLKLMPVIMLTAEATREAVLKGLQRAARTAMSPSPSRPTCSSTRSRQCSAWARRPKQRNRTAALAPRAVPEHRDQVKADEVRDLPLLAPVALVAHLRGERACRLEFGGFRGEGDRVAAPGRTIPRKSRAILFPLYFPRCLHGRP